MQGVPELFADSRDRAVFRHLPQLPGVELYQAHITQHSFEPHTHEAFGIGGIISGAETFRYRGASHTAGAGSLVMMNPDELHTGHAASEHGWSYRMIYLDGDLLSQLTGRSNIAFDEVMRFDPASATKIIQSIGALWQSHSLLEQQGLLYTLAEDLQPILRHRVKPDAPVRFTQVRDYLHANYMHSVDLQTLAELVGLSRWHFLRQFQAHFHASPHQMLMAIRLWHAKRLLTTGMPAAQVAAATGLTDQAHLTRSFQRRYGTTPARYQKQVQTAI